MINQPSALGHDKTLSLARSTLKHGKAYVNVHQRKEDADLEPVLSPQRGMPDGLDQSIVQPAARLTPEYHGRHRS
jgi:hypothetical protein